MERVKDGEYGRSTLYENRTMKPVEIVPRRGRDNDGGVNLIKVQ
jgi:hypothetical protein